MRRNILHRCVVDGDGACKLDAEVGEVEALLRVPEKSRYRCRADAVHVRARALALFAREAL